MTVVRGGLALLSLGVLPAGCAGDEFSSCSDEASGCPGDGAGGGAGADGDSTSSSNAGGMNGTSGGLTASGGWGASGGSAGSSNETDGEGSGGSLGAGASGSGGSSSNGTSAGGAAGESGLGEGGEDATGACEDTCDGTCCGDVCVDLESDIDHCGTCGARCTLDQAEEACVAGACVVTACWDQSLDCNGDPSDGCEEDLVGIPDVPAPTRPVFGAFTGSLHARVETGSLRPEFVWTETEAETCSTVTYHLQVDDSCTSTGFTGCVFPSPEIDVTGLTTTAFAAEADLPIEEDQAPVGRRYYWRVRACEGGTTCSEWSDVFYVNVGRVRDDVTGDGYADIVGATEDGELFIARGSARFDERGEAEIIPAAQAPIDTEAKQLSFLGDVNGDGFNDVGGAGLLPSLDGQGLYVWLGAETFGVLPGILVGSGEAGWAMPGLWSAGDVDHDGYADMMLRRTTTDESRYFGWLTLKFGSSVLGEVPGDEVQLTDTRLAGTNPMPYRGVASGDFNGDGYVDAVSDSRDMLQHSVEFMLGGDEELSVARTVGFVPEGSVETICSPMMITLDFNGDGIDDVAALCRNGSWLSVVFGARDLATRQSVRIWHVELETELGDIAGGDIDDSGFDDLILSDGTTFWGAAEPDTDPSDVLVTPSTYEPMVVGDHDADGAVDLVRAHHWYPGLVTRETPDLEMTTQDGESFIVIALAH